VTEREFEGVLESVNSGRGAAVALPFDPRAVFGRARAPLRVTVTNHEPFTTSVAVYGGVGWIGFRKAQLADMGLTIGNSVTMSVELDDQPRRVEEPVELAAALASDQQANAVYEGLSFTERKEYARWVAEAARYETRERRATETVRMLREGIRSPRR
jgi:hypothetical protein